MKRGWKFLVILAAISLIALMGCSDDSESTSDGDTDGDTPIDGDEPDGDDPDGDEPDGDEPDGDEPDGDEPDGDEPDGDEPDGDEPDGDEPDGDEPDGDVDGDAPDGDSDGDDPDGDTGDGCSGHGTLENGICYCDLGWAVDPEDDADCIDYSHEDGVPYLLKIYMHSPSATKIYLESMSVIGDIDATDYDVYVSHLDGPSFELGANVQAINLGNTDGFDEVTEVPESGYASDGTDVASMVIGTSYRTGGQGSTGFDMSGNIYALKIGGQSRNVTYAKIEVIQAKAGVVHVLAYWQPDGSRDVTTNGAADGDEDGDVDGDEDGDADGEDEPEPLHVFREGLGVVFDANMGAKLSFDTMGTVAAEDTWDFELFAIGGGPGIRLGDGVTGIDNGNGTDFHDVDAAPDSGYAADAAASYIIGDGFRNGGSGGTGFVMTENVYILKRADGSYAKLEVLSAQSGVFRFHAYHQPGGSTDLSTHDDPGESDVWAHVIITCASGCNTNKVVVYGNTGSSVGGMPSFMNTWDSDIQFPIHAVLTQTGMTGLAPISQGQHALRAYQDIDTGDGMGYQDGDPLSQDIVIDFQAGSWNLLTFELE